MDIYKKWVHFLTGFLIFFLALNYIIWKGFAEDILTFRKYYNGGLDRMGYIVGSKHYRKPESTLPGKHIENTEYKGQHIDVLTIGDSFSNTKNNGKDPMYQDWIASLHHVDILNIQPLKRMNEFSTIIAILNTGYLDKIKPRFIIMETVERNCINDYATFADFKLKKPLDEIEKYYKTAKYKFNPPQVGFINEGNFKFIIYGLLYAVSDNAYFSKVYVKDLNRSFFTVKKDKRLLFYYEDLTNIPLSTFETVRILNENLNKLASLLKKKGITLYFMPAPDKYNMYSDYIVNNPYPKSVFFELLRKMPKKYIFVDTKAILAEEIRKGEKDVYYADDTHWSWKGSKKIAESMKF